MPVPTAAELPVLYGDVFWISPYFFTAFVAAREKGVALEIREISLPRKEHRTEDYLRHSLTGRIPSLKHGDFWLAESNIIADYLDEAFPGPRLYPEDLRERSRARQLMAWIRSDLLPVREERSTYTMFYERSQKRLSEKGQEAAQTLIRVANLALPEGQNTLFKSFCIADADLAFVLQRLILNGDEVPARLRAYADAQWKRPSVREFCERQRPPFQTY